MSRYSGVLLVLLLALCGLVMRQHIVAKSERLLLGEDGARSAILQLYRQSQRAVRAGDPHPGLAAIIDDPLPLRVVEQVGTEALAFAEDDSYVYGLATRSEGATRRRHGFILRAWPREFGRTGDREFYIDDGGVLREGLNEKGRGGLGMDAIPPFPDPQIGEPGAPWITIWSDEAVH